MFDPDFQTRDTRGLQRYFVIERKVGPFKPEYTGKLNFYLSDADDLSRTALDAPTLGLPLCESRGASIVEYSSRDIAKPFGVWTCRPTRRLPGLLRDEIPSIEDLQRVIDRLRVGIPYTYDISNDRRAIQRTPKSLV